MSTTPGPEQTITVPLTDQTRGATPAAKPLRVLACMLCQQRKVRCERKFPCQNCVRAGMQCVPTTLAQRRRRFPERELLDRLSRYEDLLRQNNIDFESLHTHTPTAGKGDEETTVKSEAVYEAKNLWHAIDPKSRDPDHSDGDEENDEDYGTVQARKAWDQYESNDYLLFGSPEINADLSSLHPGQIWILKLWQVYLENVNPLLKVTHTPTLQARIIDAAGDIASISPSLEALMFSIYCVSIHSLVDDECRTLFGSPRKDLLMNYQISCQRALLKCRFLRSSDRDCLTALYLYLISVRPDTDARSLSSMLGAAIRIAQRMKIHNEFANAKCTALEAEMRRRLWWSLIIFDARVSQQSGHKDVMLAPTWNCRTALNVNDFDLRSEMKTLPAAVHADPTEALFAVVLSELNNFTRNSSSHLNFTNPVLKSVANPLLEGDKLVTLEKTIEDKYLKFCNPENPLHFVTMWTARGCLAKNHLIEHYSRSSKLSVQQTDTDLAMSHALRMVECDTKLLASPVTKNYLWWLLYMQFPFPAYLHICKELRRRPIGEYATKGWEVLSDNYEARFISIEEKDNDFFKIFARIVLQAWAAREASDEPQVIPRIVSNVRSKVAQITRHSVIGQSAGNGDDFLLPMPVDFGRLPSFGAQVPIDSIPGEDAIGFDVDQLDWTAVDWNPLYRL